MNTKERGVAKEDDGGTLFVVRMRRREGKIRKTIGEDFKIMILPINKSQISLTIDLHLFSEKINNL